MAAYSDEYLARMTNLLATKVMLRRSDIAKHMNYVKGRRGTLRFVSDEFQRYISRRFKGFTDNWCLPVAQAPVERISFKGFTPYDPTDHIGRSVWDAWNRSDADRGLSEAALVMTAARRSYGLVTDIGGKARITFENPDSCAVCIDPLTGVTTAGILIRQGDDEEIGQLLLPDATYTVRRRKTDPEPSGNDRLPPDVQWTFDRASEQANGLGEVPLVEFRNQSLLDNAPMSDISMVEDMQDTVNVVWAYLLNGLDWATLPGRLILGGDRLEEPVLDAEGNIVGSKAVELDKQVSERILQITGDGVRATEWSAANLNAFIPVIEKAVEHIAAETRTPGHYLLTKAEVPATGYEVAEAGLVSKTNERIGYLKGGIRTLCRLAARIEQDDATARIIETAKVDFSSPLYRNETQMADAMLKYQQLGFPLQWIAERMGLGADEIDRIMRLKQDETRDPELEALNRSLRIGEADATTTGPDGKPTETRQTGTDRDQNRQPPLEQGQNQ
ncbi:phage portal protein [Bifidobacterium sp. 82T24]|uniref:phage portal protein n=1 Tax=Bifidobacterium pluvialisilvae TaxID=2834436 RepID=UPI001C565AD3|nr:phage portal protein [Bifidobacterium pluvialisilvae]MBW3088820.1 phage portal protein [Bifidobacterium pluvialisilvae]